MSFMWISIGTLVAYRVYGWTVTDEAYELCKQTQNLRQGQEKILAYPYFHGTSKHHEFPIVYYIQCADDATKQQFQYAETELRRVSKTGDWESCVNELERTSLGVVQTYSCQKLIPADDLTHSQRKAISCKATMYQEQMKGIVDCPHVHGVYSIGPSDSTSMMRVIFVWRRESYEWSHSSLSLGITRSMKLDTNQETPAMVQQDQTRTQAVSKQQLRHKQAKHQALANAGVDLKKVENDNHRDNGKRDFSYYPVPRAPHIEDTAVTQKLVKGADEKHMVTESAGTLRPALTESNLQENKDGTPEMAIDDEDTAVDSSPDSDQTSTYPPSEAESTFATDASSVDTALAKPETMEQLEDEALYRVCKNGRRGNFTHASWIYNIEYPETRILGTVMIDSGNSMVSLIDEATAKALNATVVGGVSIGSGLSEDIEILQHVVVGFTGEQEYRIICGVLKEMPDGVDLLLNDRWIEEHHPEMIPRALLLMPGRRHGTKAEREEQERDARDRKEAQERRARVAEFERQTALKVQQEQRRKQSQSSPQGT